MTTTTANAPVALQPAPPASVGDLIMHYLLLEDVSVIFGIPGGGLMNMLVDLKNNRDKIRYIISSHETGAAYMADGYYRATGKIGVVVVTTGPGATNALTGVMNAQADGSALMLITGEIDQKYFGMGYLQEGIDAGLNIESIYSSAIGYSSMLASATDAATILKQAFRDALSLPRQAVHLSLPVNVTVEALGSSPLSRSTSSYRSNMAGAPIGEVRKAMQVFLNARRPLLFLGNGCREALRNADRYAQLIEFVEAYGIPVVTTADGKGVFPESHELSFRVYGVAGCMWPYQYLTTSDPPYDAILVIGSSLGELSTNSWLPILSPSAENRAFIQVDINQKVIARSFEVTQGIVAEAGAFIEAMSMLREEFPAQPDSVKDRMQFIKKIKANSPYIDPAAYESRATPIHPASLMRVLQQNMPPGTQVFIDAGNCVGWSVHYLAIDAPSSIFTSLSMGPMGFAVGAVVGAKLGKPESPCVAIVGDGAFLMHGSEVSTASKYRVGAIWIVLYDNNLSMVSQGMDFFSPDNKDKQVWHDLYELGGPDLELFSRSLGADAYTIDSPDQLEHLLPEVFENATNKQKPQVVIAKVDASAVPPYYNPIYMPQHLKTI